MLPPGVGTELFGVCPGTEQGRESMLSQEDRRMGHFEIPVFYKVCFFVVYPA